MGLATSTWGPRKPIYSVMNTSGQSFISCVQPPALERLRKLWRIQSNVICHPGKQLNGKSPIIGLLSRGKWKIIAGNNTKVPSPSPKNKKYREALICETLTSEKTPNMQFASLNITRKVCILCNLNQAKKNHITWTFVTVLLVDI